MSNLAVPCAYAWTPPTITDKRDTVKIKFGTGNSIRKYDLHVEALRARSEYFHELLAPTTSNEQRSTVHLELSATKPFDIFANWLYNGNLDNIGESKLRYLFLCELHVFADSFRVPLLRNKIIDVFFNKVLCGPFSLPYDIMKYIQENLRDSALRAMMQDIMLNCGELEEMAEWQVNLAKGFQVKHGAIEVKGGVAPFAEVQMRESTWSD